MAGKTTGFLARHSLALFVTVAVPCALWTMAYFALLLWAAAAGGGLGSPASYPLGLLFILACGTAVGIMLFLPSVAVAEWIAQRQGFPILAQIPITLGVFTSLYLMVVFMAVVFGPQRPLQEIPLGSGILFLAHLLPLGLYWWTAQSLPILLALCRSVRATFRS